MSTREPAQEGEPQPAQDEPISLYQNTLLAWGNLLYEDSQLAAATGADWRPVLDRATARFREAGCNEPDIIGTSPPTRSSPFLNPMCWMAFSVCKAWERL